VKTLNSVGESVREFAAETVSVTGILNVEEEDE